MGKKEHHEITPKLLGGHAENQRTAWIQRLHPLISTLGKKLQIQYGPHLCFFIACPFFKGGQIRKDGEKIF